MTVTVDLAQAREWIGVPATLLPDDQLELILAAETSSQARLCRIDPVAAQPDLEQAILRRVARAVAARGVPLGLVGIDAEYGAATLPRWDAEIERYERPWRIMVFG